MNEYLKKYFCQATIKCCHDQVDRTNKKKIIHSTGGFISEPYAYREYFDSQGYAQSRIYSDSEGPQPTNTYEGRFTTHTKNGSIYTKTITSAGLTVDLPSPDSGIGTDAITPRDQNNIQQVNLYCAPHLTLLLLIHLIISS